jgi:hypothetical protein
LVSFFSQIYIAANEQISVFFSLSKKIKLKKEQKMINQGKENKCEVQSNKL